MVFSRHNSGLTIVREILMESLENENIDRTSGASSYVQEVSVATALEKCSGP